MKGVLSNLDRDVLATLKGFGRRSIFQMAEMYRGQYDIVIIMRSVHKLLQKELLVRQTIEGERYYLINMKNKNQVVMVLGQDQ